MSEKQELVVTPYPPTPQFQGKDSRGRFLPGVSGTHRKVPEEMARLRLQFLNMTTPDHVVKLHPKFWS